VYPGGLPPEDPSIVAANMPHCERVAPGKPVRITEAGYQTNLEGGSQPGVSERVQAIYTERLLLQRFLEGVRRTDLWAIVDQECGGNSDLFGLYRCDWSAKPAARALKRLLAQTEANAPDAGATLLRLGFDDAPADLRWQTFKEPGGDLIVALWRTASIWDRDAKRDLPLSPARVEVAYAGPVARLRQYDPTDSDAPTRDIPRPNRLSVQVGAKPVLLRLTPR
jgi:hypothetical protein